MARRKVHPGSIDRVGNRWRVRLGIAGKVYTWTVDISDLKDGTAVAAALEDARQLAREKDAELRGRSRLDLPGPMRFAELLDRYDAAVVETRAEKTQRSYRNSLKAFRTYFVTNGSNPHVHAMHSGHIESYLVWRRTHSPEGTKRKNALSARSLAKDRTCLHAIFQLGKRLKVTPGNPVQDTDVPKGDKREPLILDAEQYERLLRACRPGSMLHTYVLLLGETGMRCESEALWLRWQDVDFGTKRITVESVRKGRRTKSGRSRKVPMTRRLRDALRSHFARLRFAQYDGQLTSWIFHHETTRRHAKAGARIESLRRAFTNAVARAELPADLVQHDLRHRRVTTWLEEGKPAHKIQKAMGHSDLRTTMMYEHLLESAVDGLVADDYADEAAG